MWQLTHPVGVDGGSKQRLGQGDIAQHRMQEEGRGGRVAAHDGVCNRILKQRATFWVKLVCGVRNRILQHAVQHSGSCLCVEYAIASCNTVQHSGSSLRASVLGVELPVALHTDLCTEEKL